MGAFSGAALRGRHLGGIRKMDATGSGRRGGGFAGSHVEGDRDHSKARVRGAAF